MSNYVPIVNLPFLYINDLKITNDSSNPDEVINISSGQCRDSSNVYDMVNSASLDVNNTLSGLGGLDTGTVAASKVYYVLLVSDPVSGNPIGGMLSLSATAPLMPFGYSAFRVIGYAVTASDSDFLLMQNAGNNNARIFTYDVPIATAVTAGNSATYADVALDGFVPRIANLPVLIEVNWTANAAADTLALHARNATGDTVKYIAQVAGASAHWIAREYVNAQLDSGLPEIQYKVSAGTVAINVAGFQYYI